LQAIAEPPAFIPFSYLSLADTPAAEREQALNELVAAQEAQLDLAEGLLLRVTLIDQGADQPGILLLVTHSLAVDGFSRRILAEDLQSAYANGFQKEVFELLSRFGNGAKSFRELPPESFVPIREAIDNGALT